MAANKHMLRTMLYVGDLHPEVTEKDLTETFAQVGPLLSVHLCRDESSRRSLCFAYVKFWFPCHAFTALKCLNRTVLRGKSIRVMWNEGGSFTRRNSNGDLLVENLDKSITSSRLQETFSKCGTILSCKVVEENGIGKGFGFVQFDSEDAARAAINAFHGTELEGKKLYVSKFLSEFKRKGAELGFRSLCVKNLDKVITEDLLKDKFSEHGKVSNAAIMRDKKGKSKGFGYVKFDSHDAAKRAMEVLNGELLGSKNLFVGRALKKSERRKHFRLRHGYNYADHCKESKASNLYVKNLDASVDDKKLEELFSGYGKVISAKVIRNGGVSRGFGFVHFSRPDDAKKALNSLTGADFEGRTLYVAVARSKEQQTSKLYKSYEKLRPQPLCASNSQQRLFNVPYFSSPILFKQPISWYPTSYQYFVRPFNSSNPFEAQNFQGTFYALPIQLATLNQYWIDRYLGMWQDHKSSNTLQAKIINGDGKELCEGSGTAKNFCTKSSPEINKARPGDIYALSSAQNHQPRYDSQGTLKSPKITGTAH